MNERDSDLLREAEIEIVAFCLDCQARWCTLEENTLIEICDICGSDNLENVCNYEDVITLLRKLPRFS